MFVSQRKPCSGLATPQSIDRGPNPKVFRYMKVANERPSGKFWYLN